MTITGQRENFHGKVLLVRLHALFGAAFAAGLVGMMLLTAFLNQHHFFSMYMHMFFAVLCQEAEQRTQMMSVEEKEKVQIRNKMMDMDMSEFFFSIKNFCR